MKTALLYLLLVLHSTSKLFIKRVPDYKLKEFIGYKQDIVVSPYKSQEKIETANLHNYLPIKFHLQGAPFIRIRKRS